MFVNHIKIGRKMCELDFELIVHKGRFFLVSEFQLTNAEGMTELDITILQNLMKQWM